MEHVLGAHDPRLHCRKIFLFGDIGPGDGDREIDLGEGGQWVGGEGTQLGLELAVSRGSSDGCLSVHL